MIIDHLKMFSVYIFPSFYTRQKITWLQKITYKYLMWHYYQSVFSLKNGGESAVQ